MSILCQHCKKNVATINHFDSHLCEGCYISLYGELDSNVSNDIWAELISGPRVQKKVCPVCGTTLADYERTGLVGCACCYDVFREELLDSIVRIHGKSCHVGKVGSNKDEFGLHRKLSKLREQLELALSEKRYDDAERLNRRIRDISKTLNASNGGNDEQ